MVGRVETDSESVHRVAGAGELGELLQHRHDMLPELSGAFGGDAGVANAGAQVVGLVGGDGFGCGLRDRIDEAGRAAVVPLVDRPHPPGAHHLEHPGVHEDVDVVGHGALRAANGRRQLADGGVPVTVIATEFTSEMLREWIASGSHRCKS